MSCRMMAWPLGVAACLCAAWLGLRWLAVPACVEVADKIAGGMTVIDNLVGISLDTGKEWESYFQKYKMAAPSERETLNKDMMDYLNFKRREAQKLRQYEMGGFQLDGLQRFMLYARGVKTADVEAFRPFYLSFFNDTEERLDVLETYLKMDPVPEISMSSNENNMRFSEHSANLVYYGYLQILSPMPNKALKNYRDLSTTWKHFPTRTGLRLPKDEYERLEKIELDKMNALLAAQGSLTSEQLLKLEWEERKFKELKAKAEAATSKEMVDRLKGIVAKAEDVGASRQKLLELQRHQEELDQKLLEKCALSAEDGPYLMWGKIVRLAKVMNMASQERKNRLLPELNQRLDFYAAHNADAEKYAPAAKAFYGLVAGGGQALGGVVVMDTQDNKPHPVLKVGDIVLARKGQKTNTVAEYKKAKEEPGEDVLDFLRMNENGRLVPRNEIMPPTDVLVGFLVLLEPE